MGPAKPRSVLVAAETDDRNLWKRVRHLLRIDPGNVRDHEIRWIDAVLGDEMMARQEALELAPKEDVDSRQQNRRHGPSSVTPRANLEKRRRPTVSVRLRG